tara:strand:- start:251 stop:730 length:480 start_codon:yes stop_codon:yes gene_type:complete
MFALLSLIISFSFAKNHGNGIIINIDKYEKKEASWHYKPDVIVCNDSPYTVMTVKKAVSVWKREGVSVGEVYKETSKNKCYSKGKENYIQIMGYRKNYNKNHYYAKTWDWSHKKSKSLYSVDIEFAPDISNSNLKLLVHELGHSFGYKHANIKNDIMVE